MKNLVLSVMLLAASASAPAQGFFKKPEPVHEAPAPVVVAPAPAVNPEPAPAPTAHTPPKTAPKKVRHAPRHPAPKIEEKQSPQVDAAPAVEKPAPLASAHPTTATTPVAPADLAARGIVDPVQACAGGWGIAQAICRSVQCQRAESFHHSVCVEMRAEQAARPRMGSGE